MVNAQVTECHWPTSREIRAVWHWAGRGPPRKLALAGSGWTGSAERTIRVPDDEIKSHARASQRDRVPASLTGGGRRASWVVVGAGVLGSLYAARLATDGADVRIVARGERADEIERHGIVLVDEGSGSRTTTALEVIRAVGPDVEADVALVLIRRNQLGALLPSLAVAQMGSIVVMTNNGSGPRLLVEALGHERVLLGFPGAGGMREGGVVRYRQLSRWLQPTTIGELDGRTTPRLRAIALQLAEAGFPVAIEPRMDAWLRTHASVVAAIAHGIYRAGGSTRALGRDRSAVSDMLLEVRRNLGVLALLGIDVVPGRYRALVRLPLAVLNPVVALALRTEWAELVFARHANAARDEMAAIDADLAEMRALALGDRVAQPEAPRRKPSRQQQRA